MVEFVGVIDEHNILPLRAAEEEGIAVSCDRLNFVQAVKIISSRTAKTVQNVEQQPHVHFLKRFFSPRRPSNCQFSCSAVDAGLYDYLTKRRAYNIHI